MQHLYFDTSKLNAQYDQFPPLRGLGAGVLSTGRLGSLGVSVSLGDDAVDFPWREESGKTTELQQVTNEVLREGGYCEVGVDGRLGPATCGAVRLAINELGIGGDWSPPSTCQSFTAPRRPPCGGGGGAAAPRPTTPLTPVTPARAAGGGTNWLLIGGVVAAGAIGAAIYMKPKRRR